MKHIIIKDKTYQLPSPDDFRVAEGFINFATPRIRKSFDVLCERLKDIPEKLHKGLIEDALKADRMPLSMDSPEIEKFKNTFEGGAELMRLVWTRHQPELTLEQCWDLHLEACKTHGQDYLVK